MLVCLQFESIGRRKQVHVLPHLIVSRTMSPLHTRITNASRRAQSPSWKTACAYGSSLEVFDLSAVCPLRHKGLLCWGAYGSSVG